MRDDGGARVGGKVERVGVIKMRSAPGTYITIYRNYGGENFIRCRCKQNSANAYLYIITNAAVKFNSVIDKVVFRKGEYYSQPRLQL